MEPTWDQGSKSGAIPDLERDLKGHLVKTPVQK